MGQSAAMLDHSWGGQASREGLPAPLEAGAEALVGGAGGGLADRAGDGDAFEQFLFGADLAEPFVVARRQRAACRETGAGVRDREFCRLVGLMVARGMAGHA